MWQSRVASAPAPGSEAAALLASVAQLTPAESEMDDDAVDADDDDEVVHSPPGVGRRGTLAVSHQHTGMLKGAQRGRTNSWIFCRFGVRAKNFLTHIRLDPLCVTCNQ